MPAPMVAGRVQLVREHVTHHNTQADGHSNAQSDRFGESRAMQAQVDAHGRAQKWAAKVLQKSSNSPPNKAFKKCMPAPMVAGRVQLVREHVTYHNTQADGLSNSQSDRYGEG
jgi:hypothetical protein